MGFLLQSANVLAQTIIVHQLCCPWLHLPWAASVHRVNDFAFPTDGPCANLSNSTLMGNIAVGEEEWKSSRIHGTGKKSILILDIKSTIRSKVTGIAQHVNVLEQTLIVHQHCCPWLHLPWAFWYIMSSTLVHHWNVPEPKWLHSQTYDLLTIESLHLLKSVIRHSVIFGNQSPQSRIDVQLLFCFPFLPGFTPSLGGL